MRNGFYQVTKAPRWDGWVYEGSGGCVETRIKKVNCFDGKVGFYDQRIIRKVLDLNRKEDIPLIFLDKDVGLCTAERYHFSLFRESEIKPIDYRAALKKIGESDVAELLLLEHLSYGHRDSVENKNIGRLSLKEKAKLISDFLKNDFFESRQITCLEDIPSYLLETDKKVVQRNVAKNERIVRANYTERVRQMRADARLRHQVVGAENLG